MMRFGLLALVSTAATAFYGEAVRSRTVMPGENRNCPTIGVNVGIIDEAPRNLTSTGHVDSYCVAGGNSTVPPWRHSEAPRNLVSTERVDSYCVAQRNSRVAFTPGTNSEASEFQFGVTHEKIQYRYTWDMSNDDSVWIAGQPKFLAMANSKCRFVNPYLVPDRTIGPELTCQDFSFDYRHDTKALVENDVRLIIVPQDENAESVWKQLILQCLDAISTDKMKSLTFIVPKIHLAAVTLSDSLFTTRFGYGPPAPYEARVVDAVKAVVYEDLKYSMSDKFPLCSPNYTIPRGGYRPLCPSTQILAVRINFRYAPGYNPSVKEDGIWRDGICFRSFDEVTSWTPLAAGWQSQKIKDWSLIRVVYDISTNWGDKLHFSEHAQTAMVIVIPRAANLLLAPRANITETHLNHLTVPVARCEANFEYTWDHFVKGIWDHPKMVVILAPERKSHKKILQEVKRMIDNAEVRKRMLIVGTRIIQGSFAVEPECGDCLDELLTYYRTEIPLEFGNCRAEFIPASLPANMYLTDRRE